MSTAQLERRDVMARVLAKRGDALVVTGLGSTTYDAFAVGDSPLNFYLWGAMGGAAMIGLGLAHAQPQRRVVIVTGDGEMLMGIGALATIGAQRVANLSIVVIDNEHYAETGMQPTATNRGVDLCGIARASAFAHAETVRTASELDAAVAKVYSVPGPVFVVAKVIPGPAQLALPPRDGPFLRSRFRTALLGDQASNG